MVGRNAVGSIDGGPWPDLRTPDLDRSRAFYRSVLGWSFEGSQPDDEHSVTAVIEGRPVAGLHSMPDGAGDEARSGWVVSWPVDDVEAAVERVRAGGGSATTDSDDSGDTRFATIHDPTGAVLGLVERPTASRAGWEGAEKRVADLVSKSVISVELYTPLRTVVGQLIEGGVSLVIVADSGSVAGVISEHDVLRAIHDGADLDEVWASDVMSTDLVAVPADQPISEAARRMAENRLRHLLVIGDGGGVVSIRDVLEAMIL